MWAQLMKVQLKPGTDDNDIGTIAEQLRAAEQPGSGLLRTLIMRDQKDPTCIYTLVLFESEERAREREADPRREEGLSAVRATLANLLAAPPEFTDLTVAEDWTP